MLSLFLLILLSFKNIGIVYSLYENGYIDYAVELSKHEAKNATFMKSMYSATDITYTINCKGGKDKHFELEILLEYDPCHRPDPTETMLVYKKTNCICVPQFIINVAKKASPPAPITKASTTTPITKASTTTTTTTTTTTKTTKTTTTTTTKESERQKRANPVEPKSSQALTIKKQKASGKETGSNLLHTTNKTGMYKIIIKFTPLGNDGMKISGRIESRRGGSYLSAITYPLLPFYGVMSFCYLMYGIVWFCCSCFNWKDILRVQFWVGGVIALGMFENAVYYSEYQSVSTHGKAFDLLYFAEIVSSAKRALARVLVIIVSIGFGIVRPRLGQTLQKVLVVGGLFFMLASIEGCIRVKDELELINNKQMFALVPLTVVDVSICWWIFTSLVQTTRTLRIRNNIVKLTLYRHFTNILIFTVLVSLAYMVYTVKENKFSECVNISMFWLQEALWPFLFALILAVIMFLWRPSVNNQRYAFTPLDMGDNEEDDMTLSDAFGDMKMRNKSDTVAKNRRSADDDLRWVEENIPSVPSTLLPTIDSDEEILTTKFEVSKMN